MNHPAEIFLTATREERARRLPDMPPMVSVVPGWAESKPFGASGAGSVFRRHPPSLNKPAGTRGGE